MGIHLFFSLGQDDFAIGVNSAVEVLRGRKPVSVPELPDFVTGVVDVRGEIIPMVDMRQRLGIAGYPDKSRLLLVRSSLGIIALGVDDVKSIENIDASGITQPPMVFRGIKRRFISGLYKGPDSHIYIILNMDNVLNSKEKILLEKAREAIEARL